MWLKDPRSFNQSKSVSGSVPEGKIKLKINSVRLVICISKFSPWRDKWNVEARVPVVLLPQITVPKNCRCVPETAIEEEDVDEDRVA